MSELGKANEKRSMGLPRAGANSCSRSSSSSTSTISTTTATNTSSSNSISSTNNKSNVSSTRGRGEKRAWEGSSSTSEDEPSPKLVCTSPPHALCAEDVPQQPDQPLLDQQPPYDQSKEEERQGTTSKDASPSTEHLLAMEIVTSCAVSDDSDADHDTDDEEDKDSGFIDSNSIDNSSDDEMDVRLPSTAAASRASAEGETMLTSGEGDSPSEGTANTSLAFSFSCENSVTATSTTLDKLSLSSSPSPGVFGSSDPLEPISGTALLPSCSSAFSTYSSLSPLGLQGPVLSLPLPPTSLPLTPTTLPLGDHSFSESSPDPNFDLCQSHLNTSLNGLDTSDTLGDDLSTSIALSVDILNNPSSTLSCLSHLNSLNSLIGNDVPVTNPQVQSSQPLPSLSIATRGLDYPACTDSSNMSIATVNSDTTVTSAYPSSVSTPAYDPHSYQPYPLEFQSRANGQAGGSMVNGTWSCNFYDANQPTLTNKYMEIQTSKMCGTAPSQAIQCDANGKSYMDLGSSSPYTQTYSSECANYTTSPSNNYSNSLYNGNQTFTNTNYNQQQQQQQQQQPQSPQPNQFYRPGYSQYGNYPNGENYPGNFEGEGGCSYGYPPNYSSPPRSGKVQPPRCASPFCDPTKSSLRTPCYQQQRLSVLNLSMCKLNRFSRCTDPSLHKSVLIYNTLRLIEKEFESEGTSMNTILSQQHMMQSGMPPHCPPPPPTPPPPPLSSEGPLPPMHPPLLNSPMPGPCTPPPVLPPPIIPPYNSGSPQYRSPHYPDGAYDDLRGYSPSAMDEDQLAAPDSAALHGLRGSLGPSLTGPVAMQPHSLNVSPLPFNGNNNSNNSSSSSNSSSTPNCCSDERPEGGINWCSVLSLPSQSDLDTLNNNEYCEWGSESSIDMDYTTTSSSSSSSSSSAMSSSSISVAIPVSSGTEEASVPQWKLPSLSADDVLKSFPEPGKKPLPAEDLDNLISGLVVDS